MNQLKQLYARLSWAQRIWLVTAIVAGTGGIFALAHWNQERDFKPLFTNMAPEDAGELVTKLKEGGIDYRLAENGSTVQVASDRVAEARLQMAAQGLPTSGRIGYELFDKANFGASEFTEQVNYHRAIEGELERSIMSIREVEQARVHLTLAKESLYSEARQPAKASVLLKLRTPAPLSAQNIGAICQLTAGAVPGLSADQVSVIDTNGNLLNRPRPLMGDGGDATDAALDYRKTVERDIQGKIAATLEPLLGAEHFRIGVSADVDLTSGEQSEETFDPQKSVMTMSQTTEDGLGLPTAAGVPGTASNLPRPTSRPATGVSNYARRTENVSYQTSRLVKHTKLPQGSVKRLSLSVLVDHTLRWEGAKRIVEPPSPEKLKVIRDLVTAATGLDPMRGDQLAVEAFPFESTLAAEPLGVLAPAPHLAPELQLPAWLQKLMGQKNFRLIAGMSCGVMLVLLMGTAIAMRRAKDRRKKAIAGQAASLEAARARLLAQAPVDEERQMEAQIAEQQALQAKQEADTLKSLKPPAVSTKKTGVLLKHIAAETKRDPSVMAHVVRSWLSVEDQQ